MSCSFTGKTKKYPLPKVHVATIPAGNDSNWRYLGMSADHQLSIEINDASITACADTAHTGNWLFQDRKTANKVQTVNNYEYQYIVSWWEINCTARSIHLNLFTLYDKLGIKIFTHNNDNIIFQSIPKGSIAQLQYNYVCLGINNNIGY